MHSQHEGYGGRGTDSSWNDAVVVKCQMVKSFPIVLAGKSGLGMWMELGLGSRWTFSTRLGSVRFPGMSGVLGKPKFEATLGLCRGCALSIRYLMFWRRFSDPSG